MRVLVVDDEPLILKAIERSLFDLDEEFEIVTAIGGQAAIDEMENGHFDALITDARMPGVDGPALLKHVHAKSPSTVRVVLSGYADSEATMDVVQVAHQFLAKPCSPQMLRDTLIRAHTLQGVLDNESLRHVVGSITQLPSVPKVFVEVRKKINDPDASAKEIAAIISKDPAISAKLLQVVNSAFFVRGASIATVDQAMVRLGFETVKRLVLLAGSFQLPPGTKMPAGFSIDELAEHALATSKLAEEIASSKEDKESASIAGMLHDIGALILATQLSDTYAMTLEEMKTTGESLVEAERRVVGVSHAEVGAYLLGIWGLPYPVIEAVAFHHDPDARKDARRVGATEAVLVASALIEGREISPAFVEQIGIADSVDVWRARAAELHPPTTKVVP